MPRSEKRGNLGSFSLRTLSGGNLTPCSRTDRSLVTGGGMQFACDGPRIDSDYPSRSLWLFPSSARGGGLGIMGHAAKVHPPSCCLWVSDISSHVRSRNQRDSMMSMGGGSRCPIAYKGFGLNWTIKMGIQEINYFTVGNKVTVVQTWISSLCNL